MGKSEDTQANVPSLELKLDHNRKHVLGLISIDK